MRRLLSYLFGKYCEKHNQHYKSDFCPQCVRARETQQLIHDERKEWIKAEGTWPIKNRSTE